MINISKKILKDRPTVIQAAVGMLALADCQFSILTASRFPPNNTERYISLNVYVHQPKVLRPEQYIFTIPNLNV